MNAGTGVRTSYSRLSTWLRCPRKFRYRYVDEAPEERTPAALLFGTAIHEAVELHLSGLQRGQPPQPAQVFDAFDRAFNDSAALADEHNTPVDWGGSSRQELLAQGEGLLATFLAELARDIKVVGTEVKFCMQFSRGRVVEGVIDLLLDDGNGRYRVVDLKTATATFGPDRLNHDMQPTVYLAAAEHRLEAAGRVNFEYWLLLKTRKPQFKILPVVRDARDRAELIETIDEVDKACASGVFPRIRGHACAGCEYASRCARERG